MESTRRFVLVKIRRKTVLLNNPNFVYCVRYTKLPPVCPNTLRANMEVVTKAVEKRFGEEMPDNFGLLLDGWSHGTEHYRGVSSCYTPGASPSTP
ncbi:hypothetical protein PHMEG_00026441 [Phytophthora megakarya]|uniref:Uncharacterized protein n=1 Tax=Phytophthora megakarya TaxID=4795 RepID=A0A225V8F2_9STRA|nr:hypothetical protein PHMEG_00026441 [Phytophthora megakarya]